MEQWIEKKQSINPRTMRARLLLLIVIALISAATSRPTDAAEQTVVYAQECITNVDNATVHIPADVEPSLPDGAPVEPGDTLAVYTEEGICAGYGVWEEGKGATFAAAGSDSVDVSPDGYSKEEPLKFEVFDVSTERTAEIASNVTFASCDDLGVPVCAEGTYEEGTFHQVAEFQSDSSTPVTRAITLAEGWNFISVPVQTDLSFEELLPECSSGFLYAPGEGYTAIDSSDPLPAGKGAAVQCEADTTSVSGSVASPTFQVEAGWNLIGSVEDTVDVAAITTSPEGMLESDFFKLPPGEGYEPAMELHPGEGYWVKTAEAGTIDVSGESAPVASTPEKLSREQGSTSRLVFVDASGRQTTLWLEEGMSEEQLSQYELPPVPPGEIFDVRFASGHQAVSLTPNGDWGQSAPEHRVQVLVGGELAARRRSDLVSGLGQVPGARQHPVRRGTVSRAVRAVTLLAPAPIDLLAPLGVLAVASVTGPDGSLTIANYRTFLADGFAVGVLLDTILLGAKTVAAVTLLGAIVALAAALIAQMPGTQTDPTRNAAADAHQQCRSHVCVDRHSGPDRPDQPDLRRAWPVEPAFLAHVLRDRPGDGADTD